MTITLFLMVTLALLGCSTPEKGEVWENRLTRNRIQIDMVGTEDEIRKTGAMGSTGYPATHTGVKCVGFRDPSKAKELRAKGYEAAAELPEFSYVVMPLEEFKKLYTRID